MLELHNHNLVIFCVRGFGFLGPGPQILLIAARGTDAVGLCFFFIASLGISFCSYNTQEIIRHIVFIMVQRGV